MATTAPIAIAPVDDEARFRRGGNKPPIAETLHEACDDLNERLPQEFADLAKRSKELKDAFARVPEVLDDDTAPMVSDQISQITAHSKAADAFREAAVAPVLAAQRAINGWFAGNCFDALDEPDKKKRPGAKQLLNARLTVYQQAQADKERRRREEEERKAREAAEAAERARQEAERIAREAREAEMRRIAEEERRVREAAEAEARRQAEERRKLEEAAAAEAAAIQNAKDLDEAIAREAAAKIARDAREAQAKAAAEAAENTAREHARKAAAEAAAARIKADADAKAAKEAADRAASEAAQAAEAAKAKAASMGTVRGGYGSSASLKTEMEGFIIDKAKMVEAAVDLWPFIAEEDLQKALNGFVKTNGNARQIAGAEIKEVTKSQVRG